ncbi:MAG: hypothetical protein KC964_19375, partial [Candidatus Omnitrophica bacterium]|nr:hypothetical protein [Candidatus Omnitrophota bacterium]
MMRWLQLSLLVLTLPPFAPIASGIAEGITSSEFISHASEVLPIEDRYEYHQRLKTGPVHQPALDPDAQPKAGEMTIPFEGWRLIIRAEADPLVQHAAEDLQDFLQIAMNVKVELVSEHTLEGWKDWSKAIVAGTRDHLPVVGEELEGPKDYEIRVSPDRIVVCGFDPSGVRFGLFDLEERMSLREAPFLPKDLHTVRHSLF